MLRPDMKIGLGWGTTLREIAELHQRASGAAALRGLAARRHHPRAQANPAEFAWQFSRIFLAECYLLAAPAIVDSAATKRALIERCGLKEVFDFARSLDAVVVSVGSLGPDSRTNFYGNIHARRSRGLAPRGRGRRHPL